MFKVLHELLTTLNQFPRLKVNVSSYVTNEIKNSTHSNEKILILKQ